MGTELYYIWGEHRSVVGVAKKCFRFRYFVSFRNQSALKATGGENRCQSLDLFSPPPVKIKGGIGEMSKWIFIFKSNLAANILYILAGCRCAGWESGDNGWVMVSKKQRLTIVTSLLYFVVRVGCRRETVHVRYLIFWWASCVIL